VPGTATTLTIHDPADGSLVGELDAASPAEVEAAVGSAVKAAHDWARTDPAVRAAAVLAAAGSLLGLLLGVSRTTLAMARDRRLPGVLAAVHPRFGVPHHAELAVGAVVLALTSFADLRGAVGFSSVAVLVYYAVANASALTLPRAAGARAVPVLGLAGCLLVAAALAGQLKAIADPARLRVLSLLLTAETGEACTCDLVEPLGLSQPTVTHHLRKLADAGIVTGERRGKWTYYRLEPVALEALRAVLDPSPGQGAPPGG
jgi:DNA-binding transcriptional ArsR family regulator